MYDRTVRFFFIGCPEHVVSVTKAAAPLPGFRHEVVAAPAQADVIFAGPESGEGVLAALESGAARARLVFLPAAGEEIPETLLAAACDIWRLPMPDGELRFHFARLLEQVREGRELWQARHFLEAVLETSPNMIWFKSREGSHDLVNAAFCRAVGKTRGEVLGRGHTAVWDVPEDDPACIESERVVMESGETHASEEVITTGAGERQLIVYKSPLRGPDGSVL